MTEAAIQQECVSTLKTLNNTIVTIRTFPANTPQVNNAVARGYNTVYDHLRKYGDFSLALADDNLLLCGEILSEAVIRSISNLIVYRQLQLLESPGCNLKPGLDQITFEKLLEVFSAKVDQIRQEGGGFAFARKLGAEELFFGEETARDADRAAPLEADQVAEKKRAQRQVSKELVDALLGRETRKPIVDELKVMLAVPVEGAPVFIASLGGILEGLRQNKVFANSAALNQVLGNYEQLAGLEQCREFMAAAAEGALQELELPALALLMSQRFQAEGGRIFSESLLHHISCEKFAAVIGDLREKKSRLRLTETGECRQSQFLDDAVKVLLATPKGKQYLGREKAQGLLDAGAKARRAQRVQAGVRALMQGNMEVLGSEEFLEHLPFELQKMANEAMETEVPDVLEKIAGYFVEAGPESRIKLIRSLVQIGDDLIGQEQWRQFELLADPLLIWLRDSETPDAVYERVCVCLQVFMGRSWQQGQDRHGDRVLSMLYRIRSGKLNKNGKIREVVSRVQDRRIDRALLAHLLTECLENPKDEVVTRRLILQGPAASRFLIEQLMQSGQAQNRFKIMELLTYGEQFLPAIIMEKLAEPMAWYGKRNLLKLLGETGSKEHLQAAFPLLQHEDMRVQLEAFNCLYKISGDERKNVLLQGLAVAGEAMKLQIMQTLVSMRDGEVIKGVEQLLADYRYYSEEFRDALLIQACKVLARCPLPESELVLQRFLGQRGNRQAKKIGNTVWAAAQKALGQLEETQRAAVRVKVKPGQVPQSTRRQAERGAPADLRLITGLEEERQVIELLSNGRSALARQTLLSLIGNMARQRRFTQAEKLRDWLMQLDPLALKEIIRAAEIIAEEKQVSADRFQQDAWVELSDSLSTEEFGTLYHALERRRYGNDEIIVQQGDEQRALYFINSGRVKLCYRKKNRDILLKLMQPGEILGGQVLSEASAWTFSAAVLDQAEIAVLQLDTVRHWRESYPALESKLKKFSERFENSGNFFELAEKDRREHVRKTLEPTPVTMALLSVGERSFVVELKGELQDLSQGGLSLAMEITRKDNARLMLGRSIQLFLPYGVAGEKTITFHGQIVAVREKNVMKMEYSIHIRFFKELNETQIAQIARLVAFEKVPDAVLGS